MSKIAVRALKGSSFSSRNSRRFSFRTGSENRSPTSGGKQDTLHNTNAIDNQRQLADGARSNVQARHSSAIRWLFHVMPLCCHIYRGALCSRKSFATKNRLMIHLPFPIFLNQIVVIFPRGSILIMEPVIDRRCLTLDFHP